MAVWTTKQIKVLREVYPSLPKHEVEQALAPHPWRSVVVTAANLRIQRYYRRRNWRAICQGHVMQTGLFKVERTA